MKAKRDARAFVQELRRQGLSYRDILQQVPVSKSSVSLWCRTVELDGAKQQVLRQRHLDAAMNGLMKIAQLREAGRLVRRPSARRLPAPPIVNTEELEEIKRLYQGERLSVREVAARLGVGLWHVYRRMRQHGIPRRRGTEQNYATYKTKPRFTIKMDLTPEDDRLRVAGIMLYATEGTKAGGTVNFANSDPRLVALFVRFLRVICGVAESRLRVLLYAYEDQPIEELKTFWSGVTGIPVSQFSKPYLRKLTANVTGRKMPHGLAHIRYADTRLLQLLHQWIGEFTQFRAGT